MATQPALGHAIEVFYSYSHRDEAMREELERHLSILKRTGAITAWHDRKIGAGGEWDGQIATHLESARVILLLISADFLASDYCWDNELERALARHQAGTARVIPIILHPVDWEGAPFSKLQALPTDARPVSTWPNRAEAFADIAKGIRAAVRELAAAATGPLRLELWTAPVSESAGAPARGATATYQVGDKIVVRFRATRDCYLTLLNIGTSGKLTVLFPNALCRDNRILAAQLYQVPGIGHPFEYQITGPSGRERLKAVATLRDVPLLESHFAADGSLFRTVSPTAAARDIAVLEKRLENQMPEEICEAECCFSVV